MTTAPLEHLFLSAMTIAEIQTGVELTRIQDPKKTEELESWLIRVIAGSQIIPMDAEIGREWARMMLRSPKSLENDAWIAATAKSRGLTLVTRKVKDFAGFGVALVNPFKDTRPAPSA